MVGGREEVTPRVRKPPIRGKTGGMKSKRKNQGAVEHISSGRGKSLKDGGEKSVKVGGIRLDCLTGN